MKAVKDSMVLIHLAKTSLLEKSCSLFNQVLIPQEVYRETVVQGKESGFEDAWIIEEVIQNGTIKVKEIKEKKFLEIANQYNIYGGEAEAFALYKEEHAQFLISDDDNLRKKKILIDAHIIGSLAILLQLRQEGKISKERWNKSIDQMRELGWFSNAIIDKVLLEGEKYG